jgi:hypothetical protein
LRDRSPKARAFVNDLAQQLFHNPMVEVTGSPYVDITVNRLHGHLTINLVNTSGPHTDMKKPLIESIDPVGPLGIKLRFAQKPARIILEPGDRPLDFTFQDGQAQFTIPTLEIHSVIVVE